MLGSAQPPQRPPPLNPLIVGLATMWPLEGSRASRLARPGSFSGLPRGLPDLAHVDFWGHRPSVAIKSVPAWLSTEPQSPDGCFPVKILFTAECGLLVTLMGRGPRDCGARPLKEVAQSWQMAQPPCLQPVVPTDHTQKHCEPTGVCLSPNSETWPSWRQGCLL